MYRIEDWGWEVSEWGPGRGERVRSGSRIESGKGESFH